MKKLILVVLLLTSFVSFSQKKKEIKKYGIKTISSTETRGDKTINDSRSTFNSSGLVTEEINYDKEGNLKTITKYKYNPGGEVIEELEYDEKNSLKEKRTFKYNTMEEKTEELVMDANGKQVKKIIYIYDSRGLKTGKNTYDANNNLVVSKKISYTSK